ncbi:MAG: hypothetical protein AB1665_06495, partial [Candidatus Thermoplasmatota archaeon]
MGSRISLDAENIQALRALEMQKGGMEDANWLMYQYGKCIGTTNTEGLRCMVDELPRMAAQLAISDGILSIEVSTKEGIVVSPHGERSVNDDHFCAGYLAGMVSALLGEEHVAEIREGVFAIVRSSERIEPWLFSSASGEVNIPDLERGESYLIVDEVKNAPSTFKIFITAVRGGMPGLCISRIFPPRVAERYEDACPVHFQTIWLSTTESSDEVCSIKPERYDHELYKMISAFLKESRGVVMLHGIEFL